MGWDLVGCRVLFDAGNGRRLCSLLDRWCGDVTLSFELPYLLLQPLWRLVLRRPGVVDANPTACCFEIHQLL